MHITIMGGGSWGTALAHLLAGKGHDTVMLVRDPELARGVAERRENVRYLPGLTLAEGIRATTDPEKALDRAELLIGAVPCQSWREALRGVRRFLRPNMLIVCASKGVEISGLSTMGAIVREELAELTPRYAVISGPSFAAEVVRDLPTAVVLGCADPDLGARLREVFTTPTFRSYSSRDVLGVELGGAVKNVIAIAAGISDGLGFGHNTRAALITRGLAEITRLGVALGAEASTFMGLSGLGDLVLTCNGDLSRNRQVGLKLAEGKSLNAVAEEMFMVAEGVKTVTAIKKIADKLDVSMPITQSMHEVLYNGLDPRAGVRALMSRELKDEQA